MIITDRSMRKTRRGKWGKEIEEITQTQNKIKTI